MLNQTLDKDLISQPQLWRMAMVLGSDRLDVALYPPVSREEIIWRRFTFPSGETSQLKLLEDIIYSNPLLLSDFKNVDCFIDNVAQFPIPVTEDPEHAAALFRAAAGEDKPDCDVELYSSGTENACIALTQRPEIKAFLTRTFYNIRFDSRKAAICRHLSASRTSVADTPEVLAPIRDGKLTLAAFSGNRLLLLNDFKFSAPADAAYYILASMNQLQLDLSETPLFVGSPGVPSDNIGPILAPYVARIHPLPFPMLHYRASRQTLQAPLELLSLCV